MSALRRSKILITAVFTATLTAACTAGTLAPVTTVTQTTDPASPVAPSSSAAPVSRAVITTTPQDAATGASVIEPVVVRATNGTLDAVAVTNPDGKEITGVLSADRTSWTSGEPLGYDRSYRIEAAARDTAGLATSSSSSFTTVAPAATIFPSFEPPPDRGQVGVGQPLSVIFDKAPPDKAAAERALTVTSVPAQPGSWYWTDERTLHYRPQQYWQAGTKITLDAKVYGVNLGAACTGKPTAP
ncbi:MAG TPA: Ig-like domain-containing protein [Nakamurella sp.]|nr:Ig-like domain-containing protein [Nakamurella sp.]